MSAAKPITVTDRNVTLPCAGTVDFRGLERCLPRCMNCRREVEGSLTRIAGRRTRNLRAFAECSAERCAEFLRSVKDENMRLHLSSMAWWRFSADNDGKAEPVLRIMAACRSTVPDTGTAYVHRVLKVLSPLTQTQLTAWFGCANLYQIVSLFVGERPAAIGPHCGKCRLYKQGCTAYGLLESESCPFWDDSFVQQVAAEIAHSGGSWRDPCRNVRDVCGKGRT